MTGYYPYQNIRYGDFLNKKEDNTYVNRPKQWKKEMWFGTYLSNLLINN